MVINNNSFQGFDSNIAEKDSDYFSDAKVSNLRIEGDTLTADVNGSELYHVSITLDNDGYITSSNCTCPAQDGCCKHLLAVLYAAKDYLDSNGSNLISTPISSLSFTETSLIKTAAQSFGNSWYLESYRSSIDKIMAELKKRHPNSFASALFAYRDYFMSKIAYYSAYPKGAGGTFVTDILNHFSAKFEQILSLINYSFGLITEEDDSLRKDLAVIIGTVSNNPVYTQIILDKINAPDSIASSETLIDNGLCNYTDCDFFSRLKPNFQKDIAEGLAINEVSAQRLFNFLCLNKRLKLATSLATHYYKTLSYASLSAFFELIKDDSKNIFKISKLLFKATNNFQVFHDYCLPYLKIEDLVPVLTSPSSLLVSTNENLKLVKVVTSDSILRIMLSPLPLATMAPFINEILAKCKPTDFLNTVESKMKKYLSYKTLDNDALYGLLILEIINQDVFRTYLHNHKIQDALLNNYGIKKQLYLQLKKDNALTSNGFYLYEE